MLNPSSGGEHDMRRPIHFEMESRDVDRAIRFYSDVFGWEFNRWEEPFDYWLIKTGSDDEPGIHGGLMKYQGMVNTVNTIDVEDIDEYIAKVKKAGGEVTTPKTAIPGIGWHAYCKDPDGNLFGIIQGNRNAK
jgi:predicted enzyme related to lactoylglutathione lyase